MISACDELANYIASLNEHEAEEALDLLQRHFDPLPSTTGPHCPACGESDLDALVWFDDEDVGCETCGHCWAPNTATTLPR